MERSLFLDHLYGENVYVLNSSVLLSYLAKLGHPETTQPEVGQLITLLYQNLFDKAVDLFFPEMTTSVPTRMSKFHPEACYHGKVVSIDQKVVTVDLARAGTIPSQICFERLNYLIKPENVRQDHFYISRKLNDQGEVIGVDVAGSKIGGDVDNSIILFPDPMGATGSTMVKAYEHYTSIVKGAPKMMVALHLIITPEYLAKVTKECPQLKILAIRLDRGLSSSHLLKSPLGKHWKEERGLNEHQYIVPGAGGLGEILNNSYC
jgi:uracil phosphoribosyltransferase